MGDSRTIVGSLDLPETGSEATGQDWSARQISVDHKPELKEEYARIVKAGGRVDTFRGSDKQNHTTMIDEDGKSIGPNRVWLKEHDVPGLAMSRSLGDLMASQVGVICVPEVFEEELKSRDKVIVLASDGIWGVLGNERVVQVISKFYKTANAEAACESLVEEAAGCWESEGGVVDDITVIVVFLG